jgi:spermidine synthase
MFVFNKYLSYLYDILLEEKSSLFNPVLKLYLSQGQFKLITKGAVYSYGNLYYNFRESFQKLDISKREIKNVLILGLGTGSIIQLLGQKFKLNTSYDIVEIDPVVVELFEKYKNEIGTSSCKIHVTDALDYMKSNQAKYDLVCMDIFCDNTVPEIFETEEFLMNLKNAISTQSVLIYNRLAIDKRDQIKNETFFRTFQNIFPTASILKLDFNWMFVVDRK